MPHLALTIGDPTGIGPEITANALQRLDEFPNVKLTVIGSIAALENAAQALRLPLNMRNPVLWLISRLIKPWR